MGSPMLLAEELEDKKNLFSAPWERFRGYGVMGLPFASGNLLAFRRMTASSIGPPFTSVWYRDPSGTWSMFVNEDPGLSCPRFFGSALDRVLETEIELSWEGPMRLSLQVPEARLQWAMRLSSDSVTRAMSWIGRALPGRVWKRRWVLSALGRLGGRVLRAGAMSLSGRAPNHQRFVAIPRLVFRVEATAAVVDGKDLGPMGPLPEQARLGDFWIPNRGIFAISEAGFESLDPTRHSRAVTRWALM